MVNKYFSNKKRGYVFSLNICISVRLNQKEKLWVAEMGCGRKNFLINIVFWNGCCLFLTDKIRAKKGAGKIGR